MKQFSFSNEPGVICGLEDNPDLFIRLVVFEAGYIENEFHHHPNSYEFYLILNGTVRFDNQTEEIVAKKGSIVYFHEQESHRISRVEDKVTMLLIKKVGAIKIESD